MTHPDRILVADYAHLDGSDLVGHQVVVVVHREPQVQSLLGHDLVQIRLESWKSLLRREDCRSMLKWQKEVRRGSFVSQVLYRYREEGSR